MNEARKMNVSHKRKGLAGLAGINDQTMLLWSLQKFKHFAGNQAIWAKHNLIGLIADIPDPSLSEHQRMQLYSIFEHFDYLLFCFLIEMKLFIGNCTVYYLFS